MNTGSSHIKFPRKLRYTGGTVSAKKLYPKKFCSKCTFCAKCTLPKKVLVKIIKSSECKIEKFSLYKLKMEFGIFVSK